VSQSSWHLEDRHELEDPSEVLTRTRALPLLFSDSHRGDKSIESIKNDFDFTADYDIRSAFTELHIRWLEAKHWVSARHAEEAKSFARKILKLAKGLQVQLSSGSDGELRALIGTTLGTASAASEEADRDENSNRIDYKHLGELRRSLAWLAERADVVTRTDYPRGRPRIDHERVLISGLLDIYKSGTANASAAIKNSSAPPSEVVLQFVRSALEVMGVGMHSGRLLHLVQAEKRR
jgi:hypothetical protein